MTRAKLASVATIVALGLTVGACDTPFGLDGRISYQPHESTYQVGDIVSATIVNDSHHKFYGGMCVEGVQRREGSEWVSLPPSTSPCPALLIVIGPGDTYVKYAAADGWAPGEYRFVEHLSYRDNRPAGVLYSKPFIVVDTPSVASSSP